MSELSFYNPCGNKPYSLRPAATDEEREDVYAFRHRHYYSHLAGAPGVDNAARRVYSPHDSVSVHLTGHDENGELLIVGTGTSATVENLPPEWKELLCLKRLASLGLENILIYSRLVEHSAYRGSPIFVEFFKYSARYFSERGYAYSIHYCAPALVPLYERLGFRAYGKGYTLSSGLYRIPMILLPSDTARLGSILSTFAQATEGITIHDDVDKAIRLFPELATPPLCAMRMDDCLAFVRGCLAGCADGDIMAASVPDMAGKIIRKSAVFSLAAGDKPLHPSDASLLWLLLEGSCSAVDADGKTIHVTPGMFVNGCTCREFTALEPGRILFFTPRGWNFAAAPAVLPPSIWQEVAASPRRNP